MKQFSSHSSTWNHLKSIINKISNKEPFIASLWGKIRRNEWENRNDLNKFYLTWSNKLKTWRMTNNELRFGISTKFKACW